MCNDEIYFEDADNTGAYTQFEDVSDMVDSYVENLLKDEDVL